MCDYLLETDYVTQTLICDQQLKAARENEMPVQRACRIEMRTTYEVETGVTASQPWSPHTKAHTELRLTWLTEDEI